MNDWSPSSSKELVEGDVFNFLNKIGRNAYKKLCHSSTFTLENIYLGREGLPILNHDYLVLELKQRLDNTTHFIRAEKLPDGIHIEWCPEFDHKGAEVHETFPCCSKRLRLLRMVDILEEDDCNYHIVKANGWHYVIVTLHSLVQACLKLAVKDNAETHRLSELLMKISDMRTKAVNVSALFTMAGHGIKFLLSLGDNKRHA